jgi:hypothetical protein
MDGVELKARSGLPWAMLRFLHHFLLSKGIDIMANEKECRLLIKQLDIEYESGHWGINNKLIKPYIHVLHFWKLLQHLTIKRHQAGLVHWWPGQPIDTLLLCIGIDKGGKYTKIQMLWMNHKYPQTEDAAFILGMYEGAESHAGIQQVFGPLLKSLAMVPSNWSIKSECRLSNVVDNIPSMYYSDKCEQCMRNGKKPSIPLIPRRFISPNVNLCTVVI